jgi:uncharacterized phage infection (PIP) family protein YhgE
MQRKGLQFGLSTLLAGVTFSAIVFSWAATFGAVNGWRLSPEVFCRKRARAQPQRGATR